MRLRNLGEVDALGIKNDNIKKQLMGAFNDGESKKSDKSTQGKESLYPSMSKGVKAEREKRKAREHFALLPEFDPDPDPESVLVRESIRRWGHGYHGGLIVPELIIPPRKFRIDVAIIEYRIALEFDGWAHHSRKGATQRDHEKMQYLAANGWLTLKVGKKQLMADREAFFESVDKAISHRRKGSWSACYNKPGKERMSFHSTLHHWELV